MFDDRSEPLHQRGVSSVPGLYFLGRLFLHAVSSAMVHGVGRDAEHLARAIRSRMRRIEGDAALGHSTSRAPATT